METAQQSHKMFLYTYFLIRVLLHHVADYDGESCKEEVPVSSDEYRKQSVTVSQCHGCIFSNVDATSKENDFAKNCCPHSSRKHHLKFEKQLN